MDSEYEISFEEMDAAAAEGYAYQAYQMEKVHRPTFSVVIDWRNLEPLPPHRQWSNEPGYDYLSIPF